MARTKLLKGRNSCGTVYYSYGGWAHNIYDAQPLTTEEAKAYRDARIKLNKVVDVNNIIGQLKIITPPKHYIDRQDLITYMLEGNSKEDLASLYLDLLKEHDEALYEQSIRELREQEDQK